MQDGKANVCTYCYHGCINDATTVSVLCRLNYQVGDVNLDMCNSLVQFLHIAQLRDTLNTWSSLDHAAAA